MLKMPHIITHIKKIFEIFLISFRIITKFALADRNAEAPVWGKAERDVV